MKREKKEKDRGGSLLNCAQHFRGWAPCEIGPSPRGERHPFISTFTSASIHLHDFLRDGSQLRLSSWNYVRDGDLG